jgi:hypothetical protein
MVIAEVTDEMVPQVREFLCTRKEFGFCHDWDGVFNYTWKQANFPYGYAIVHQGTILGFLGTMFCERVIGGNSFVYCNLSTWVVDDGHKGARSLAAALLAPVLKIKNVLITCFTANDKAQKSYEKIGFKRIDDQQIALPTLTSYCGWGMKRSREVTFDTDAIKRHLNEKDSRMLRDHKNLKCTHLLVRDTITNQYCYLIGTTTPFRLRRLPLPSGILSRFLTRCNCFNVCYASSPIFLVENIQAVNKHLWRNRNSLALRYDSRLISHRLSVLEYKMPTERLCFSATGLQAVDIDDLYSELVTHNTY